MIIATPDGKFYSQFWSENDGFTREILQEITHSYATHLCEHNDYVVFRRLTSQERIVKLGSQVIDISNQKETET